MNPIRTLSLTAIALAFVPSFSFAAGPTPPGPGDLPPTVLTGGHNDDTATGYGVGAGGIVVVDEDGTSHVLDKNGEWVMDCEEKLSDCLDFLNGTQEEPEDPPKGGKGGKGGKKGKKNKA